MITPTDEKREPLRIKGEAQNRISIALAAENRLIETGKKEAFFCSFFFELLLFVIFFNLIRFRRYREYKYAKQLYIEEEMIQRSILLSQI